MDAETQAARDKLKQRFGSAGARIGGKGTVRRKAKAVTKTASSDDKKLVSTLKRLGVNTIPGIEEVSIFKDDGSAIVFSSPKVQASIGSNTYVITGTAENKTAAEMLPSMMSSMAGLGGAGGINAAQLKMLQEALAKGGAGLGSIPGLSGLASALGAAGAEGAGDEDVPELEGDFESASEK